MKYGAKTQGMRAYVIRSGKPIDHFSQDALLSLNEGQYLNRVSTDGPITYMGMLEGDILPWLRMNSQLHPRSSSTVILGQWRTTDPFLFDWYFLARFDYRPRSQTFQRIWLAGRWRTPGRAGLNDHPTLVPDWGKPVFWGGDLIPILDETDQPEGALDQLWIQTFHTFMHMRGADV